VPLEKKNLMKALDGMRDSKKKRGFKQSIELIVKLQNVDLKKPENRINEAIELPNKLDKPVRICVIAGGDLGLKAKKAKAELVIDRKELEKLSGDKKKARKIAKEHDYFIAEAPLMPLVGKALGQSLGPRGKMPTPITPSSPLEDVMERHRRMVRIKVRENPAVQCRVGLEDMPMEKVVENIEAIISHVESKMEKGSRNIASVYVKYTMSPPVKLAL